MRSRWNRRKSLQIYVLKLEASQILEPFYIHGAKIAFVKTCDADPSFPGYQSSVSGTRAERA